MNEKGVSILRTPYGVQIKESGINLVHYEYQRLSTLDITLRSSYSFTFHNTFAYFFSYYKLKNYKHHSTKVCLNRYHILFFLFPK